MIMGCRVADTYRVELSRQQIQGVRRGGGILRIIREVEEFATSVRQILLIARFCSAVMNNSNWHSARSSRAPFLNPPQTHCWAVKHWCELSNLWIGHGTHSSRRILMRPWMTAAPIGLIEDLARSARVTDGKEPRNSSSV